MNWERNKCASVSVLRRWYYDEAQVVLRRTNVEKNKYENNNSTKAGEGNRKRNTRVEPGVYVPPDCIYCSRGTARGNYWKIRIAASVFAFIGFETIIIYEITCTINNAWSHNANVFHLSVKLKRNRVCLSVRVSFCPLKRVVGIVVFITRDRQPAPSAVAGARAISLDLYINPAIRP